MRITEGYYTDINDITLENKVNNVFCKMVRGELSLVITFWVWMILGGGIWGAFWGLFWSSINEKYGFIFHFAVDIVRKFGENGFIYIVYAFVLVNILYGLCVWHGVFRSSENYTGNPVWAKSARAIVIVSAMSSVVQLWKIISGQ